MADGSGTSTGGTSDTSPQDTSDWSDLSTKAGNGGVGIDKSIKAAGDVFKNSAIAVNELNKQLDVYKKYITDNNMNSIHALTNELGGTQLAEVFNQKGNTIIDGITTVQGILTNMENTFIAALKTYYGADTASANDLSSITSTPLTNDNNPIDRNPPGASNFGVHNDGQPDVPAAPANPDTTSSISYKDAAAWSFDQFYDFGRSILGSPDGKTFWSTDWETDEASVRYQWMASQMSQDFSALTTQLGNIQKNMWTGSGADEAWAAVQRFESGAQGFATSINDLSTDLGYTSNFLKVTFDAMPAWTEEQARSDHGASDDDIHNWRASYLTAYRNNYEVGLKGAITGMPLITVLGTGKGGTSTSATGTGTGTGSANASNTGTGTGTGTGSGDGTGNASNTGTGGGTGSDSGYAAGYSAGYGAGYSAGYGAGYSAGYAAAAAAGTSNNGGTDSNGNGNGNGSTSVGGGGDGAGDGGGNYGSTYGSGQGGSGGGNGNTNIPSNGDGSGGQSTNASVGGGGGGDTNIPGNGDVGGSGATISASNGGGYGGGGGGGTYGGAASAWAAGYSAGLAAASMAGIFGSGLSYGSGLTYGSGVGYSGLGYGSGYGLGSGAGTYGLSGSGYAAGYAAGYSAGYLAAEQALGLSGASPFEAMSGLDNALGGALSGLLPTLLGAAASGLNSVPGLLNNALSSIGAGLADAGHQVADAGNHIAAAGQQLGSALDSSPDVSKLFPRVTAQATPDVPGATAGEPLGGPSPMGMPGMGGMGSAQQGNNNKEHKRAKYLDGATNLDEILDPVDKVRPVIEP